mgnify:CR=1 FL=1
MAEVANENEMSIWDHVGELRARLLKGMGALVLTTLVSVFFLGESFLAILAEPTGGLTALQAIDPTESWGVYMRVSLLSGFIMALPIIVYQILAFVVPGLYDNEKRWLLSAIPIATALFISGVAFAYFVMLPAAIPFLSNFLVKSNWRVSTYVEFVTNLLFWIGMSFELPLVMFVLAKLKIVSAAMLLKQWRYAVVAIALLAAAITPTVDPVNMGLLMAPLFAIYLLSALFAALARR